MKLTLILLSVIVAVFAGKHDMKNDGETRMTLERMKEFEEELKRYFDEKQMNTEEVFITHSHMNCMLTLFSSFFRIGTPITEPEL